MFQPLEIIFAGSGEFGVPTLARLIEAGHRIVYVVSQPDRPAGRGRQLTANPIARFALEHQLPLERTANINELSLPPADVMVVIAFGQKIAEQQVRHSRLGSVNLHASVLPKYRGAAPINWAILRGERQTGNSVIRLADRMDAGAVLAQSRLSIGETETAGELHDRLATDGAPLILRVLDDLSNGNTVEHPQDETQATLAPKLSRESTRIDWTRPATEIANQIRGLYPWPGCGARILAADGQPIGQIGLVRARATALADASTPPGTITSEGTIRAGQGAVKVLECHPEGKRPMPLEDYRNGHPWHAGLTIQSAL